MGTIIGTGIGIGFSQPSGAGGYSFTNSEAAALYDRDNTIAPDDTRKQLIDTLVGDLKTAGVWAKLDILQIFAAASQSASLLNWKGASFAASVGAGSPVFVADNGWFVNGIADNLDLGAAPSGLTQFAQNSAFYGGWMRTPNGVARANSILGTTTTNACTLNARTSTNLIGARINGTTADTSIASTNFYGMTTANRPSSTQIQSGRNGVRGSLQSSTSSAKSAVRFGFGKCNNLFAEGQIQAFFAGAALSDAEELALYNGLSAYMTAIGVAALTPATRTLSLASFTNLPDGSNPVLIGGVPKGMACTGITRRGDGKWYIGNGQASAQSLCFSRLPADFSTVEAEFTVSSLGLASPPGNGSVQGLCVDAADPNIMWAVLKIGNSGATTYLFSFNMTTEAIASGPFALPTLTCNGVADDGVSGTLLIAQDISSSVGGMIRVNKADGTNTGAIALQTPGDTDMMQYLAAPTDGDFQAGDLLLTAGANGAGVNGTVSVMRKDKYGGYAARRVDTLTGAEAIEGIWLDGSTYYAVNDLGTHPGTTNINRIQTYAA